MPMVMAMVKPLSDANGEAKREANERCQQGVSKVMPVGDDSGQWLNT